MNTKPIFLYTPSVEMNRQLLNKISKAGYVPVAVKSLDDVRILDKLPPSAIGPVTRAAFDTLAGCDGPYTAIAERFGRRVAKVLGNPPPAPKP